MTTKLYMAVNHVSNVTHQEIIVIEEPNGRFWTGLRDDNSRVAAVYGNSETMLAHELGHILCGHGVPSSNPLIQLLRELEAWRSAEALMYKFGMKFDEQVYAEGIDTHIYNLIGTEYDPGHEWLCQLFGTTPDPE